MNITLIQPYTNKFDIAPPQNLAYLSAFLEKSGNRVRLIDLQIPEVHRRWETILKEEPVDLVGITTMTPQVKHANMVAEHIKAVMPDTPVILGGVHATLLPEQTLRDFQAVDILVIGEGEETIVELVSKLEKKGPIADVRGIAFRSNGEVVITLSRPRIRDLDSLPYHHNHYDFDYYLHNNTFEVNDRVVSLIVSRGCPFNCRFCATKNFWTQKSIFKSTDGVIDEIRTVMEDGAECIKFRDSTFVVNKKWVYELCDKILKEKLHFKWTASSRVNLVDFDLLRHMKKAGLDVLCLGVESGSQRMLDFYGKGITLEQTEKAFEICRKLRIKTVAYFMFGVLTETQEEMEMTYNLAKKLKSTVNYVSLFIPLPGTELYQYYIDQGYSFDYTNIRNDKANFSNSGLTIEELEALGKKWYEDFNPRQNRLVRGINTILEVRSMYDLKCIFRKVGRRFSL